jgi:hypothetical protein
LCLFELVSQDSGFVFGSTGFIGRIDQFSSQFSILEAGFLKLCVFFCDFLPHSGDLGIVLRLNSVDLFLADLVDSSLAFLHKALEFDFEDIHLGPELVLFLAHLGLKTLIDV